MNEATTAALPPLQMLAEIRSWLRAAQATNTRLLSQLSPAAQDENEAEHQTLTENLANADNAARALVHRIAVRTFK